jgi:hypothetical protein
MHVRLAALVIISVAAATPGEPTAICEVLFTSGPLEG